MTHIIVDPITRIEGHLRIEADLDGANVITDAFSSGTSFRGAEAILKGRDPRQAWAITQRFCGVCTVSNSIASVRAVEKALNYPIPINAQIIRNLMIGTQDVHDHVMHFYHLHALDWVDVKSALNANAENASTLQKSLSKWPNNSTSYFTDIKNQLKTFVDSGQLGIFARGYWGHPAYKLSPEMNLLAFAHYLEALSWQREVAKVHAIFGGKSPHPSFAIGGVPCAITLSGSGGGEHGSSMTVTKANLNLVGTLITKMRTFVDQVYLPDLLAIADAYKTDWAVKGFGEGLGNFITFGDFPQTVNTFDTATLFVPRGAILGRDLNTIWPVDLEEPSEIQEFVTSSWYTYGGTKNGALHPYDGETTPKFTGPRPPFTGSIKGSDGAYSWVKSPRWKGKAMEASPLARVLIMYATGNAAIRSIVDSSLAKLGATTDALFSTLGRTAARGFESSVIAEAMSGWHATLMANINSGNVTTHNALYFNPSTWPVSCRGYGFMEAPRGALAHWVSIESGKIKNYQAIIPTTWNAGPRDASNLPGAYEAALKGHKLSNTAQPIEILRTVHSFDPCLACAVHVVDANGQELITVKVR